MYLKYTPSLRVISCPVVSDSRSQTLVETHQEAAKLGPDAGYNLVETADSGDRKTPDLQIQPFLQKITS